MHSYWQDLAREITKWYFHWPRQRRGRNVRIWSSLDPVFFSTERSQVIPLLYFFITHTSGISYPTNSQVVITLFWRRCDVMTSQRRRSNVIMTVCLLGCFVIVTHHFDASGRMCSVIVAYPGYLHLQSNLNSSNTVGSFSMAKLNSFLSLYKNKYLGKFSYFIMKLYFVCTH